MTFISDNYDLTSFVLTHSYVAVQGDANNLVVLSKGDPRLRDNILLEKEANTYCLQATDAGEVSITL